MNEKKSKNTLTSIISVTVSNISGIIAGVIIGFVIPKVTEVEGYGFYKTFTLYVAYAGMFSLGIIDGIVLEYGGVDYEKYDKTLFRSIFKWYSLIHLLWTTLLVLIGIFVHDENNRFIIIMIGIFIYFNNMVGYFQQISQITQRFKELSITKIIQSGMKILGGLVMVAIYFITRRLVDYRVYVIFFTVSFIIVTIGYLYIYKEITFGKSRSLGKTGQHIVYLIKLGFPLLIANLCSTLILTLDRQFVNLLFPNSEYAVYAFAYNMLSLVTVATSAISTVLYPILKRSTEETLVKNYSNLLGFILMFVYGALLVYFPLCKFIEWFLPKYTYSLQIFRVIFPGLAISSAINIIMHNYYKTMGKNIEYFKKTIIILIVSSAANIIAYSVFRTTISISIASIVTMIIWYMYVEHFFVIEYKYNRWKNLGFIVIMMLVFYLVTSISNWIMAGLLYLALYIVISIVVEKDAIIFAKSLLNR